MRLGEVGVGKGRGHFTICDVAAIKPSGEVPLFSRDGGHTLLWDAAVRVDEILCASVREPATACTMAFLTPLRLKEGNQLLRTPPTLETLLHRVLGRAAQLAGVSALPLRQHLLESARPAQITHQNTHWQNWGRYSARQKKAMPFGGLMGEVRYEGDNLQELIPWLRVAEWLHVGNKTTFGLGACRVTVSNPGLT